jgi:hypothetical protein
MKGLSRSVTANTRNRNATTPKWTPDAHPRRYAPMRNAVQNGQLNWSERTTNRAASRRTLNALRLAGAPGFEPGDGGIKIRCLTTWLRPNTAAPVPVRTRADHTQGGRADQRKVSRSRQLPEGSWQGAEPPRPSSSPAPRSCAIPRPCGRASPGPWRVYATPRTTPPASRPESR